MRPCTENMRTEWDFSSWKKVEGKAACKTGKSFESDRDGWKARKPGKVLQFKIERECGKQE